MKNENRYAFAVLNKSNASARICIRPSWADNKINIIMCVKKFCVSVALHYLCTQIVLIR